MKKRWIVLFGIAIMIVFGLGVKFYMDEEKLNKEMMKVIYSDEAKQVFKKRLTNLDAKAFTKEGIIQSYEIDEGSIKSNPMGGIEVRLIINNNSELYASYTMSRNNGVLGGGGVIISKELAKQTEVKD
ncbi:TPA: DUF1310 domain-containing protein [Listeria monocytogenes]|uniref:DUF1310 domain-containing protein n=1 Tax=Listeria monocytogenes TaxID=1639 RepID=A0A8H9MN37_LISMN|nr:DUF1310 domain-containing protein [Listeria monocytogenes]HAO5825701.1 DUF1310 domain-containing protein [Listeria monocytogenes]HAO5921678.1 DUF1310 domain-containing protein [Listeria monocytogenes]HAO6014302.1 DUF1310 domain-containing protein [Listeria monocytogenes]HAO6429556.1 DUF1310 domain-containing protein [Listeria monocytogenes]